MQAPNKGVRILKTEPSHPCGGMDGLLHGEASKLQSDTWDLNMAPPSESMQREETLPGPSKYLNMCYCTPHLWLAFVFLSVGFWVQVDISGVPVIFLQLGPWKAPSEYSLSKSRCGNVPRTTHFMDEARALDRNSFKGLFSRAP